MKLFKLLRSFYVLPVRRRKFPRRKAFCITSKSDLFSLYKAHVLWRSHPLRIQYNIIKIPQLWHPEEAPRFLKTCKKEIFSLSSHVKITNAPLIFFLLLITARSSHYMTYSSNPATGAPHPPVQASRSCDSHLPGSNKQALLRNP